MASTFTVGGHVRSTAVGVALGNAKGNQGAALHVKLRGAETSKNALAFSGGADRPRGQNSRNLQQIRFEIVEFRSKPRLFSAAYRCLREALLEPFRPHLALCQCSEMARRWQT